MVIDVLSTLFIFTLSAFLGFELISKVPPTLHTPLMSGSHAVAGVTIVGAVIVAGQPADSPWLAVLSVLAVAFSALNVVGGFVVTDRMLKMFKRR